MKKLPPPKGFTLIELMVAIAIVAVLSSIGLVVFSNAQSGARDSKRREDIQAVAKAIESKKQSGGVYYTWPAASDFAGGSFPDDPKSTTNYCIDTLTTIPPANPPTKPAASTAWTAAGCPSGWDDITTSAAATNFGTTTTSWTVCAVLEQGTSAGNNNVFCDYSKQ